MRFLVIQLPEAFPDPLLDTARFNEATETVGYSVLYATRGLRDGDKLDLRIGYRCTPDPVAEQLASDFAASAR